MPDLWLCISFKRGNFILCNAITLTVYWCSHGLLLWVPPDDSVCHVMQNPLTKL